MKRLRWGILSTARIGLKAVIPALQAHEACEVVAISSRDEAKAQDVAARLGIPKAYGAYEALLEDPSIEAVYNPLPNTLHKAWTVRALEAGKHVLCEKPLGMNAQECLDMQEAAEKNGVKLMEAFMYRFHPRTERLLALLADGRIGEVRLVRAAFSFILSREGDIRLSPELGGGALYDVGCYCVNAARTIIGQEPEEAQAFATFIRDTENGVDESLAGSLRFAGGALAQFDCSLALPRREHLEVVGTEGRLELSGAFVLGQEDVTILEAHQGQEDILHTIKGANEYEKMVVHFSDCVLHDQPLRYPASEAAANLRAMDALYRSARAGGRVTRVAP